MNKYDNAMKVMEDYCGNGKDNLIALATISCSKDENNNPIPAVRMVNAFYEGGVFYVSSASWKNKTKEIAMSNSVSISGIGVFDIQGVAENLGWVKEEKNAHIRDKMKQIFSWFDDHGDEDSPESIVLRITPKEGRVTDNERKFGDGQYMVDFANKIATAK